MPASQPAVNRSTSACDPARGCVRPIGAVLSAAGLEVVPNLSSCISPAKEKKETVFSASPM